MPTGAKLYARDFGTADMHGWPDETDHAMLLLASDATHRLVGTDLTMLAPDLQPDRVVTAEDLEAARIRAKATSWKILLPEGPNADLSGPAGRVAHLPRFGKVRDRTANPAPRGWLSSASKRANRWHLRYGQETDQLLNRLNNQCQRH